MLILVIIFLKYLSDFPIYSNFIVSKVMVYVLKLLSRNLYFSIFFKFQILNPFIGILLSKLQNYGIIIFYKIMIY